MSPDEGAEDVTFEERTGTIAPDDDEEDVSDRGNTEEEAPVGR